MYLSRLQLNPLHPQARRDLASAYELHRSLTRAFAADASTPPPRFLWRREADRGDLAGITVLVQAAQAAAWDKLHDANEIGAGYFQALQGNKRVSLSDLVQEGRHYRFRLLANPTVTRGGKRFGLHDDELRHHWLQRQGERHGFALIAAERSASGRLHLTQRRREARITLDTVLFDGVLQAVDASALRQAWSGGIGPGKALGLGMLSLASLRPIEVS